MQTVTEAGHCAIDGPIVVVEATVVVVVVVASVVNAEFNRVSQKTPENPVKHAKNPKQFFFH